MRHVAALHEVDFEEPHSDDDDDGAPFDDGCDDAEPQELASETGLATGDGVEAQQAEDEQQHGDEHDEIHPMCKDRRIAEGGNCCGKVGLVHRVYDRVPGQE